MIKEKLQSAWKWIKNKARRFWKWGVAIVVGGVVLASVIPVTNTTFEDLSYVKKIDNKYEVVFGKDKVEIGDLDSVDFEPTAKFWRWNKENYLTIKYQTNKKITPIQEEGKLKWKDTGMELHYSKDGENLKIIVVLKNKPITNVYSFLIEGWQEFDFFYQTSLADEFGEMEEFVGPDGDTWIRPKGVDPDNGNYSQRPLNVDGSYSVYHKTKRDYVLGKENYKIGKFLHIYKPKATDAVGKTAWTEINVQNEVYTVTIPQQFLDTAVYPIVINDTFGYSSNGATEQVNTLGSDDILAIGPYSPDSDGTATQIWFYTRAGANQVNGLFADNAGTPTVGAPIKDGVDVGSVDVTWLGGDFDSTFSVLAANSYWLANQESDSIAWRYDSGSSGAKEDRSYVAGSYASDGVMSDWSTVTASYSSRDYSAYVVYTPTGAARRIIIIE